IGRHVDEAGAGIRGDMVGGDERAWAVEESRQSPSPLVGEGLRRGGLVRAFSADPLTRLATLATLSLKGRGIGQAVCHRVARDSAGELGAFNANQLAFILRHEPRLMIFRSDDTPCDLAKK